MTEQEFFNVYRERFQKFVDDCKSNVENLSNGNSEVIINKIRHCDTIISNYGNTLISEIMYENDLDYNYKILINLTLVPISSILYQKSFSIQLEITAPYKKSISSVLSEAHHREYPNDCLEDL